MINCMVLPDEGGRKGGRKGGGGRGREVYSIYGCRNVGLGVLRWGLVKGRERGREEGRLIALLEGERKGRKKEGSEGGREERKEGVPLCTTGAVMEIASEEEDEGA